MSDNALDSIRRTIERLFQTGDNLDHDHRDYLLEKCREIDREHYRRITELLEANNREVERRREAEAERDALKALFSQLGGEDAVRQHLAEFERIGREIEATRVRIRSGARRATKRFKL
jgi:hypothetical protein